MAPQTKIWKRGGRHLHFAKHQHAWKEEAWRPLVLAGERTLVCFKKARGPSDVHVGLSVVPSSEILHLRT